MKKSIYFLILGIIIGGLSVFIGGELIRNHISQTETNLTQNKLAVKFNRSGLLSEKEREEIVNRFADPFAKCSYINNPSNPTIAMVITVPQNLGEKYSYITIAKEFGGSEGYYGVRGEDVPEYKCQTE